MKKNEKKEVVEAEVVETTKAKKESKIEKESLVENLLFKRIGAYFIDIFFITILAGLVVGLKFINPHYEEYKEASTTYQEQYEKYTKGNITTEEFMKNTDGITADLYKYGVSNYVVVLLVIFGYLVIFQKYNNGQTLGKKIFKLKVVDMEGNTPKLGLMSLRILPMFIYGYAGIFNIIACIILPLVASFSTFSPWIGAIQIANSLLGLIDAELLIARKDKRALHDIMSNTKVISE